MGFFDLEKELRKCLDSTWDFNTTCDECDDEFRNLTNYFANVLHSEANKGHCLCLDILDAVSSSIVASLLSLLSIHVLPHRALT